MLARAILTNVPAKIGAFTSMLDTSKSLDNVTSGPRKLYPICVTSPKHGLLAVWSLFDPFAHTGTGQYLNRARNSRLPS